MLRRVLVSVVALLGVMGAGLATTGVANASTPPGGGNGKVLNVVWQRESYNYWCGPAATRIALSARMGSGLPSQATLAGQLGTTTAGTDNVGLVTGVLNRDLHTSWYETKWMRNDPPTGAQVNLLWSDITYDVDHGYALVVNIDAPASNHPPGYPNYEILHYFTVAGYEPGTDNVYIVDPASGLPGFGAVPQHYWLSLGKLASLVPPKGYSA
ncbi:C39 family peptidase [Kutzneria chonburiensis]|uniref:C39 family peptidase n=1 Tax=Kutzneria chonburiensis TaxID=1483604 RepID=A0ABV6N127_9PSEU|nr:C39 family peptidase [Kutzneria chonburiensis]